MNEVRLTEVRLTEVRLTEVRLTEVRLTEVRLTEGYYLANFFTVLDDVEARYGDLLLPEEAAIIAQFRELSPCAQRLYVRMLTRKGPWFRRTGLCYAEIGDPGPAIDALVQEGFCLEQADLEALLPLLTRSDLLRALAELGLPARKGTRRDGLLGDLVQGTEAASLRAWLTAHLRPVKPCWEDLWRRVFLLFFGNFEQDLATFVMAATGRIQYEDYRIDPRLRVFESRRDVDYLLSIRSIREQLETVPAASELEALTRLALAMETHQGVRQQRRFQRLLNELGLAWERQRDLLKAMVCYQRSQRPPAGERQTRIHAAQGDLETACHLAIAMAENPQDAGEARFARKFLERQRKKLPSLEPWLQNHPRPDAIPEIHLEIPRHPDGVEMAVLEAARKQGWEGFFAENHLWRALFGLAFWEELFAAIPGAFQHRFQNSPLDIGSTGFYEKRQARLEYRLEEIASWERPADPILEIAQRKQGVANAFVSWRHLEPANLAGALACIEPKTLSEVFRVMLRNPMAFDSGFPDLFLFRQETWEWKLWEVKGPGDNLRPEQEWWLEHFNRWDAVAQVARVSYL